MRDEGEMERLVPHYFGRKLLEKGPILHHVVANVLRGDGSIVQSFVLSKCNQSSNNVMGKIRFALHYTIVQKMTLLLQGPRCSFGCLKESRV